MNKKTDKQALEDYKEGIPITFGEFIPAMQYDLQDARWGLIRQRDKLCKYSNEVGFIEWNDNGTTKTLVKGIEGLKIGSSLILAPFNECFTWMTTEITEIIESEDGDNIRFKTKNSSYTLMDFEQDEE